MALSSGPLEATSGEMAQGPYFLTLESPPWRATSQHVEFSPSAIDLAGGIWSLSHFQSRPWLTVAAPGIPEHPQSRCPVPASELTSKTNGASWRARVARSPMRQTTVFPLKEELVAVSV